MIPAMFAIALFAACPLLVLAGGLASNRRAHREYLRAVADYHARPRVPGEPRGPEPRW